MAVLIPVSGLLTDRFGPKRIYAIGIAAYGIAVFPVFALFGTRNIWLYALATARGVRRHPRAVLRRQGTLYASLYPARIRYTGLSTVYQLSGVYASGLTPLILTALIGAAGGTPWLACGYLVVTAAISVVATLLLETDTADGAVATTALCGGPRPGSDRRSDRAARRCCPADRRSR